MAKNREGLANVGRENQAPQPLAHPHSHPEALVFPATCYSLAIWTPVDSINLKGGKGSDSDVLRARGPGPIPASMGQPYLISMAWQVCGQFLGLHIPHLQCAITAAADQQPAISRPGNLVHSSHVATQGSQVPEPGEASDKY